MIDAIAAVHAGGGYFSVVKTIIMLVLLLPWFYVAPWVQKDAKRVHASQTAWSLAVLLVGAVTLLIWMVQGYYVIGLLTYVLLTSGVLMAYVAHRNSRVQDEMDKVLTVGHIKRLLKNEKVKPAKVLTKVKLYHSSGKVVIPPAADAPLEVRDGYNAAQELIYDLIWRRASEADLSPADGQTRVRYIIDGVLIERPPMPLQQSEQIIQFIKEIGGMDVEDHRRPQAGKMAVDLAGMQMEMSLRSAGTTGGQRMQFRVLQEYVRTQLDTLGMGEGMLAKVRAINNAASGLIIISGRAGSGVTSTLYSLLREQDAFVRQLETLEARPAVDLENITQHPYGEANKLAPSLSAVLRRDPDIVMVDACGDDSTAQLIAEAAASGKMILMGMPAGDTFMALAKWVKACGNAARAADPLRAVICQMLLRKLCPNCREPYMPNPEMLAKANLSAQRIERFYRPPTKPLADEKGNPVTCPACQGIGYLGRTAVFEIMEVTNEVKKLIVDGAPVGQIKALCRKNGMLYLQEQALQRVIDGVTSIQEVIRVSQTDRKH